MSKLYSVVYQNNGEMINDLLKTFEVIMLLIICRLNSKIYILKIERDDFFEETNFDSADLSI